MKHRFWDREEKKMLYDLPYGNGYLHIVNPRGIVQKIGRNDSGKWTFYWQERYIAMFCSDLPDIKDVEIYDGDILERGDRRRWVVIFKNGAFYVQGDDEKMLLGRCHRGIVVGHIYEDKEWECSIKERKAAIIEETKGLLDKLCEDCQKVAIVRGEK